MAGPPKCKSCGKVEWGHLCGRLPDTLPGPDVGSKKRKAAKAAPQTPDPDDDRPMCPTCGGTGRVNDRKKYMRELMRDKRAKAKAEKGA